MYINISRRAVWTHVWVADPNRGFSKKQPGGWCYNLLPYLEQTNLHDMGQGLPDAERRKQGAVMFGTPVEVFTCPSRRQALPWPFIRSDTLVNIDDTSRAGRSDYAANMGNDLPSDQQARGPKTLEEGDQWKDGKDKDKEWIATKHNGVIYQRSQIAPQMIEDGLSKTYLLGEKFLDPAQYETGASNGDDHSLYVGFDRDNARSGNIKHPPMKDQNVPIVWLPEGDDELVTDWNFGSTHPTGLHMGMCDGSVQKISYDIDPQVHSASAGRNDNEVR